MNYDAGTFDIAVVGAGHAGIEAALAAARLGARVLCLCTCLDAVGNMPCNPSIGGTAKGQLVREIDALGGEMGRAADKTAIQFRMLNRGKGPAVFSPRAQNDRMAYRSVMKTTLETCPGLILRQGEASEILTEDGHVCGVRLVGGATYRVRAAVLCTGTFLGGRTFTGDVIRDMGPDGLMNASALTASLHALGLETRRFKTGTPPRIAAHSVDFSDLEPQPGDDDPQGFSFYSDVVPRNAVRCWLTWTNAETHRVIRGALDRSPLFTGVIDGVGPRYCPSIEDKVVRFADKERHQLFLEPCGEESGELYVQGLSTSLPEDVQAQMLRTIRGLEHAEIMRSGYAIEYDCLNPLCLDARLAVKTVPGLFAAGQLCGSSGYEEAAAQGLVAGVNAFLYVRGQPPFILTRMDGYIGTLIDDLVTKGTDEPYRMMTSRSEYRLVCRQDNADLRLMEKGRALGLVPPGRAEKARQKAQLTAEELARLKSTVAPPSDAVNAFLLSCGTSPLALSGASLLDLLRRPEISYSALAAIDPNRPDIPREVGEQVEIAAKYEGYIRRQQRDIEDMRRMEERVLPETIDYLSIPLLRTEARQKLQRIRPRTLGQAGRISGVSPADIGALMVILSQMEETP